MGSRFNILEPHEAEVGPRRRVPPMHPPWANLGQCCGVSAAGQFLLAVKARRAGRSVAPGARSAARKAGLALASAVAARGVRASPRGDGLAMPSPEEHAAPLDTRWQAGWMQGESGVGSFLLHAHAVATGKRGGRRTAWPDEPCVVGRGDFAAKKPTALKRTRGFDCSDENVYRKRL